ncbi:MAG: hypothetical protein ACTSUE_09510 [Promethearchaeota archaeon]
MGCVQGGKYHGSSFQGTYGIHADLLLKGAGSKARVVTYRNPHLQAGVGRASRDSWIIYINSLLKPREKKAASTEVQTFNFFGLK